MTIKEVISKVLWTVQNIGKNRRISISDQTLQRTSCQTHDEVVALGTLLQELSALLVHLTGTFGDFTACTAHISELAMHVPVAMTELTESARADKAALNDVA
jgi:hypothetical protein